MFLTTTKKLKIWSVVTQAIIIVGAGHGILFFFLLEIFGFPYVTRDSFSFLFSGVEKHFATVGFVTLLGQAALLFSILDKKQSQRNLFQIVGLCLLWLSIAYFYYDTITDRETVVVSVTVIPFAVCTIVTFAGKPIKRLWYWVIHS